MGRINSRAKGNKYELKITDILDQWWTGRLHKADERVFRRTPLSGGYDRRLFPSDLITPEEFPFGIECKNRESWSFENFLGGSNSLISWLTLEEDKTGKDVLLIFTKKYADDYVMLRTHIWNRLSSIINLEKKDYPKHIQVGLYLGKEWSEFTIMHLTKFLELVDAETFKAQIY